MPGSRSAWATVPALVAAVGFTSNARPALADEIEVIAVEYEAASSCGTEDRFLGSVRRYTTRWSKAPSTSARVRTFRIVVGERRGELVIRDPGGQTTQRELTAPDCERVARGIAIAMALAIDPEADITGAASAGHSNDAAAPGRREEERAGTKAEDSPDASVDATPSSPPAIAPPPAREPRSSEARPRPFTFALEARAELTSSFAPVVAPTFGVGVGARANVFQAPGWLGPAVAIGLRQSWPAVVEAVTGKSEFVWTAATVRVCPMGIHVPSPAVDIVPCIEGNAGTLRARALPDGQTRPSTWFDLGGSLRVVFGIGDDWAIGGAALVSAPFIRHRFALVGGGLVSQPPEVGLAAGIVLERRL